MRRRADDGIFKGYSEGGLLAQIGVGDLRSAKRVGNEL